MSQSDRNTFTAVDPALGYLYQVRSALLWALQRLKLSSEFLVSIETLDDVAFESTGGTPAELLQTKHHRAEAASLSDMSTDLWKTLRVWFEGHEKGSIQANTSLVLVTTALAPEGSIASLLRNGNRDVNAAVQALDLVPGSSTSQANASAYDVYLRASRAQRLALLERVTILDGSPMIESLDSELKQEVFWAAGKKDHEAFLERLEGWWLRRILKQLSNSPEDRIGSVELESVMGELREQFKQESLPIDDDLLDFSLDDATRAAHDNSTFVRQLELVKAGKRRVAAAIRDYYRAFEQRSRWLRLEMVVDLELSKYEKRLVEEWELVFDGMRDELGDGATEDARVTAARDVVLKWAERTQHPIRASVTEPFICRGSFHILADEARIGWHPEFRDRLAQLLSGSEASA
ncbi:MAG: hypothetical protein CMJ31_15095 [Phycisphaerae bacterium]|nr:hypothetical protein [Phycisphaerae bacterium]